MQRDFTNAFTGCSFLAAAVLLWGGWMLMPVHIDTYFQAEDFARVESQLYLWIWMYRLHLFGMVVTVIALFALAAALADTEARVVIWPGSAVASAGMLVGAVGAAFYYHHGAWGALETHGKPLAEISRFVDSLRVDTEYVTCLVRFGRVFSGLGITVLAFGFLKWQILPGWLAWWAVLIGAASMALTMLLPDQMQLYMPIFHVKALWLAATGIVIVRGGVFPVSAEPGGRGES